MPMNEQILVATCLFGLERLVGEEIDALGYKRVETIDGRVKFLAPSTQFRGSIFHFALLSGFLLRWEAAPPPISIRFSRA